MSMLEEDSIIRGLKAIRDREKNVADAKKAAEQAALQAQVRPRAAHQPARAVRQAVLLWLALCGSLLW
jgi:hypothetical protein